MFYFVIDSYLKKQCNQKGYKVVNKVCERGTICQLQWGYSKEVPFSCKRGISSKRVRGWTSGPAEPPRINICWVPPTPPPSPPHCYKTNNLPYPLSSPEASLCLCVPRVLSIFSIIAIFIGIPSGSLRGSRRECHTGASSWPLNSPFQPRSQGSLRENLGTRLLTVLLRSTCRPTGRLTHRILYVG